MTVDPKNIDFVFAYDHLPDYLQAISKPCHDLAREMRGELPPNSKEVAVGLRKLLEAKDCFVRARLSSNPTEKWKNTEEAKAEAAAKAHSAHVNEVLSGGASVSVRELRGAELGAFYALPEVTTAEDCVYLTVVVGHDVDGELSVIALAVFYERLRQVIASGHMLGRLAPIVSLAVSPDCRSGARRSLVAAYMKSDLTREQLNELFDAEWFYPEGALGADLTCLDQPTETCCAASDLNVQLRNKINSMSLEHQGAVSKIAALQQEAHAYEGRISDMQERLDHPPKLSVDMGSFELGYVALQLSMRRMRLGESLSYHDAVKEARKLIKEERRQRKGGK